MREEQYPGEADEAAADEASCVEPIRPHALTREQVITALDDICDSAIKEDYPQEIQRVLDHDAAQRLTITQQVQEIAQLITERDEAERREQQWEQDYATDLRACQRDRHQAETDLAETKRRLADSEAAAYDTAGTIGVLKQRVAGLEAELEKYRSLAGKAVSEREAARQELVQVRAEKDEQWVKLCAAVREIGRLREALDRLYDVQNGCPLPKYETDWNAAMQAAQQCLGRVPH